MSGTKKFVVLEHLRMPDRGFRFWTTNTENNTHVNDGGLAYKEILFTDDTEEAIKVSRQSNHEAIPTMREIEEYVKQKYQS
jgi:hypothetical protein